MPAPKPISLTVTDPEDYTGPTPQPFTVVGEVPVEIPEATEATAGLVKQAPAVPDSEEAEAPTVEEFNALLAALRTAGVLAE